ncbi:MAG: TonB-dependent receptor [Chitinophagales bacterium]|nr:TonB-dependent receptor [Chitinophagales bacterium]MBP8752716.1 TonB-dependent receptor [Chitinophagales bacterium]MBP9189455.1 TonB-dependent receptor [Chitinophagales bacterium]MBP9704250.1 TonB-dependent receptor [Chitinophagales bacterium]
MKYAYTLLAILLICNFSNLQAQNTRTITGRIVDANDNETLPGVGIFCKQDNSIGTVSDLDGNFTLEIPASTTAIIFRSVGYEEMEVALGSSNKIDVRLKSANLNLDAVVISASRKSEKILDAPASISLITTKQIENTVAITPTANLKGVPGVDIINMGLVQSSVVTRGFNNIFGGSLLTMVDNRYAAVPSLRVNINMFIPTDNSDLERIEILRGPASALYGPNCANGVLHMITKSPLQQDKKYMTTISLGGGFRGKISDTIAIANPIDPSTGSVFANYTPEFDYENLGDRTMYSMALRHSGKVSEKFGYKILGTYFTGTDWKYDDPLEPQYIVKGKQTTDGRETVGDSVLNARDYTINKIGMDVRLDFSPKPDMQLIVASGLTQNNTIEMTGIGAGQGIDWKYYYGQVRFNYKKLFAQVFMNGSNSGETYLLRTGDLITDLSKLYAGQVQYSSTVMNEKLNLIYGMDMILTRPNTDYTINGRYEDDDNINEFGAYLQGDYRLNEKWQFIAALRGDYHNFVEDIFFSPRAAIVYKADSRNTFRLTFNRAFSAPSSNNLNLDILQLADLGGLGELGQGFYGLDYLPSIGVRASGNRQGFTFAYDDNGLPMWHSPYSQAIGGLQNDYYSLDGNNTLNNMTWDMGMELLFQGFAEATGLPTAQVKLLFGPLIPDDISNVSNELRLLNLTTAEFDVIDPSNVQDYGTILNSATTTIEAGWKGGLLNDKLFVTIDAYTTTIYDYVSPLTNITPNVFLDPTTLASDIAPQITAAYTDPTNTIAANLLDGALGDGTPGSGLEPFINQVLGAGSGVPMGTVVPTQFNDASIYVTYVNLGDVTVFGADLGVTYYATDDLRLSLGYSWVNKDSIPLEGAQLGYVGLNAPKNKVAVKASYDINPIDMNIGITFRYQESFPANSGAYVGIVEANHDLDLTFNYMPPWWENSMFSMVIMNIYNHEQQYFVGAPEIGRSMFVKVMKTF